MADTFIPDLTSPKAQQILEGARTVFLESGYEGASTIKIAHEAGVSKGTLYNYFPDKEKLFMAVMEGECKKQAAAIFEVEDLSASIEITLRELAQNYVGLCFSPFIHIYLLAITEASRFPALARAFYDSGPQLAFRRLTQLLAGAAAKGELKIDDLDLAAHQFSQLCKADLFEKRLFQVKLSATAEDINYIADSAVDAFLQLYRPGGGCL
ncbi:TetR/AcrR family transcriptional regulator [cf. Phormidesmis sp. LEGE 11477]|uniref:TetR/AcrR family transcriptional regulator n=1 Tax=cf. Phormidesmis sp. LEGE 11477 TaxID=1828680 RepID=UPI00187EE153|nr:TetR/AcrR family transcriptional regulator [cf. Phormidesmis sp. LEGE 11477]MBE9063887.1 TetR/AcrR family transcriptional regulator [cf. Phormidesmis sp. LEGE 11477]